MKTARLIFVINFLFALMACHEVNAQIIEAFGIIQQMSGDEATGLGVPVKVAANTGGGFGFGFNIENFNLNIDLIFSSTDIMIDNNEMDVSLFLFDANLDYSILKLPISPVVTAGIGSVNFADSNVQASEFNEADFSYNLGGGIKIIISDHYLIKGLYRSTWTKIKDTDDKIQFTGFTIQLGYVF
ncbi:porin family protein [candidate division KSB1 bacterium]|nr:porin family protein [candidate division KSB1 bacterium]